MVSALVVCIASKLESRTGFSILLSMARKDKPRLAGRITKDLRARSDEEVARLLRRSHVFARVRKLRRRGRVKGVKSPDWNDREIRLLGTRPDSVIARMLDRSIAGVQLKRHRLGIRPHRDKYIWSVKHLALLGTMSDQKLSVIVGKSPSAVRAMRHSKTRIRFRTGPPGWSQAKIHLLGTRPDWAVAKELGCSRGQAAIMRRRFGIRPCSRSRDWTEDEDVLLGTMPDAVLAVQLHRGVLAVRKRRLAKGIPVVSRRAPDWTKSEIKLLGTRPDEVIARKLGRTVSSVVHRRCKLKIPPHRRIGSHWRPEEMKFLGTAPDAEIARRLGRRESAVRQKRIKSRIKSFQSTFRRWTAREDRLLGTLRDEEVALRIKRTFAAVRQRRQDQGLSLPRRPVA